MVDGKYKVLRERVFMENSMLRYIGGKLYRMNLKREVLHAEGHGVKWYFENNILQKLFRDLLSISLKSTIFALTKGHLTYY